MQPAPPAVGVWVRILRHERLQWWRLALSGYPPSVGLFVCVLTPVSQRKDATRRLIKGELPPRAYGRTDGRTSCKTDYYIMQMRGVGTRRLIIVKTRPSADYHTLFTCTPFCLFVSTKKLKTLPIINSVQRPRSCIDTLIGA